MANKHYRSLSSTTRLDRYTQLNTAWIVHGVMNAHNCLYIMSEGQVIEADQLSQAMYNTEV